MLDWVMDNLSQKDSNILIREGKQELKRLLWSDHFLVILMVISLKVYCYLNSKF